MSQNLWYTYLDLQDSYKVDPHVKEKTDNRFEESKDLSSPLNRFSSDFCNYKLEKFGTFSRDKKRKLPMNIELKDGKKTYQRFAESDHMKIDDPNFTIRLVNDDNFSDNENM